MTPGLWLSGAVACCGCVWVTDEAPRTAENSEALAEAVAELVLETLDAAIRDRGTARFVLAGGGTPLRLYRLLAERPQALDWSRVEFYWGDERCVPPTATGSNYGAARVALLDPLGVDAGRSRRIRGELAPERAALEYAEVVGQAIADGGWDLVLLGLGSDGHTASLFPPRRPELETGAWVVAASSPSPPQQRVSLTLRALNRARRIFFLAAGEAKAPAVARVRVGDPELHASAVAPRDGAVTWCLDRAAAGHLPPAVQSG